MGASGSGKTSLLRAIAGLWTSGSGTIRRYTLPICTENNGSISEVGKDVGNEGEEFGSESDNDGWSANATGRGSIFFLPQKPYMVLGTLRQQLLYPTWNDPRTIQKPSDEKVLFFNSNLCFICIITCPLSSLFYPTRVIRYA